MHQALQIPDIVWNIFHHLRLLSHDPNRWTWNDDSDFLFDPNHCLAAALTCKAFLEPALDMLWYACDSLEQLANLIEGVKTKPALPDQDDRYYVKSIPYNFYYMDSPVTTTSFALLKRYSRRIRCLGLHSTVPGRMNPSRKVHPGIFQHLQSSLDPGEALFPALQNLVIKVYLDSPTSFTKPFYPSLSLFLSPSIQSLKIDITNHCQRSLTAPDLCSFVCSILTTPRSSLQNLEVCIPLPLSTLRVLSLLNSVRKLGFYGEDFPIDSLHYLAALSGLKILALCPYSIESNAVSTNQPPLNLQSPPPTCFDDLIDLALTTSPTHVRTIFNKYQFPRLTTLHLFLHNERELRQSKTHPSDAELGALFETIAKTAPYLTKLHISYESLSLDVDDHSDDDDEDYDQASDEASFQQDLETLFVPWHLLGPLFRIQELEYLYLLSCSIVGVTSEDYEVISQAWPRLRHFQTSDLTLRPLL